LYDLTSETLHENNFHFNLFRKIYLFHFNKKFLFDDNWLIWFIGFVEGDGAILESKGRLTFVLTQKESKILYEIKDVLGFGVVREFKGFSRYIVSNNPHCFLLYLIFNGNLVINHRINQLNKWFNTFLILKRFNLFKSFSLNKIPDIILTAVKPSLNDSWLSGFTDAEGCFSVSFYKLKNKISQCRIRYILDQKDEKELLYYIRSLFKYGNVNLRSKTNNVYRLVINMNKPNRDDFNLLIDYFKLFPLKTLKIYNFKLWCEVLDLMLLKKHKTETGIKLIKNLRTKMNKYLIDSKSIGSSKYS
jgi:LAGLIDADG endonuclease